jgi:NAD(P)-dependent dehydrogenase (short-subunit alcohol dehydrogenase family)
MNGKVCVVTGATSGIGEVTARVLAERGATVVMVCRDRAKAERVRDGIRARTPGERVNVVLADLASFADIRRAAAEIDTRWSSVDVLVNNAGAVHMTRETTRDGVEATFGVNHLAPFLLTNLLLPKLRASAPARIVNVSSRAHRGAVTLDLSDPEGKRFYNGWLAYSRSKLCNILFTNELARRLEGTGVTANALHPGVITTGFGRNQLGFLNLGVRIAAPFMKTPEQGARTSIYLATSPEVAGVTGRYFDSDTSETRPTRVARDQALARRLWELSERMTGLAT